MTNQSQVKHLLDTNTLSNFINALVFSKLYSCSSVRSSSTNRNISKLQTVQNFAARIVTRSRKFDHITPGLREVKYLSVESMLVYRHGILAFKYLRGLAPDWPKKLKRRGLNSTAETRVTRKRLSELPQAKILFIIGPLHCGTFYPKGTLS